MTGGRTDRQTDRHADRSYSLYSPLHSKLYRLAAKTTTQTIGYALFILLKDLNATFKYFERKMKIE